MKVNIDDLAKEIHDQAVKSGFWEDERNMGEMLMLIVSELSESLEEHRDGHPNFYKNYLGKPEGIGVELADAAIRILDTLYSEWDHGRQGYMRTHIKAELKNQLAYGRGSRDQYVVGDNFAENLGRVVHFVDKAKQNIMWLVPALAYIDRLAVHLKFDLWEYALIKMEYNATRAYKHGKAY